MARNARMPPRKVPTLRNLKISEVCVLDGTSRKKEGIKGMDISAGLVAVTPNTAEGMMCPPVDSVSTPMIDSECSKDLALPEVYEETKGTRFW
jgi:hypothetical protein